MQATPPPMNSPVSNPSLRTQKIANRELQESNKKIPQSNLKLTGDKAMTDEEKTAIKIEAVARGNKDRKRVEELKKEKAEKKGEMTALQEYLTQWKITTDLSAAFQGLGVEEPDDMIDIESSHIENIITSTGLKQVEATRLRKCYQAITNSDTSTAIETGETKETVTLTQHTEAKLPPELDNFNIIKEMESVAAVLTVPTFGAAQLAVQNNPSDVAAVTRLREAVVNATAVIIAAVQLRVQEEDIWETCDSVISAGNEDFEKVYEAMWGMTHKSDAQGCAEYLKSIRELTSPDKPNNQTTKDPAELFQHAALTHDTYLTIVRTIAEKVEGVQLSLPDGLKKMGRIIEKTILKRPDDVGNANKVCDIVRGMLTCNNMTQIADVVGHIGASNDIVVTRVKDRFFKAPSAGGWRDCMINFYVTADSNQHICEIQLVHDQMMKARQGLPGHAVYNRVRNASELLIFTERDKKRKAAREKERQERKAAREKATREREAREVLRDRERYEREKPAREASEREARGEVSVPHDCKTLEEAVDRVNGLIPCNADTALVVGTQVFARNKTGMFQSGKVMSTTDGAKGEMNEEWCGPKCNKGHVMVHWCDLDNDSPRIHCNKCQNCVKRKEHWFCKEKTCKRSICFDCHAKAPTDKEVARIKQLRLSPFNANVKFDRAFDDGIGQEYRTKDKRYKDMTLAELNIRPHNKLKTIVLGKGEHVVGMRDVYPFGVGNQTNSLYISAPMHIVGDPEVPKEEIVIVGGIWFGQSWTGNGRQGKRKLQHLTLRNAKEFKKIYRSDGGCPEAQGAGVFGECSFTMDDVLVEQCAGGGVVLVKGRARCKNVEVRQCGKSGVAAGNGASITLVGPKTTVHHNCTKRDSDDYGLLVYGDEYSKIYLISPLTIKKVATKNGGGGNWGAYACGQMFAARRQIKNISPEDYEKKFLGDLNI